MLQVQVEDEPVEYRFSMPDPWARKLFLALLRRYGLEPYRYYRQRRSIVMVRVPERFLDETLWPEYEALQGTLYEYLGEVTDFGDPRDPTADIPERARRFGEFFGTIVSAATAWPFPDTSRTTALRCRRRPGRRPCPGLLDVVLVEEEAHISWACTACDDNGLIHGWEGTHWDLTSNDNDSRELDDTLDVIISHEEYAALLRIPWYDDDVRRTILSAQANQEEADLWGSEEELDDLLDVVAGEANHERLRTWRARLDGVFDKLEATLKGAPRGSAP